MNGRVGRGGGAGATAAIALAAMLAHATGCQRPLEHTASDDSRALPSGTSSELASAASPSASARAATEAGATGTAATGDAVGLSDDFSGARLDPSWSVLFGASSKVALAGGALQLTPISNSVWFHADRSVLVHKRLTGDFSVTTVVRARKVSVPEQPVDVGYQFGGLMARSPSSDAQGAKENHVFAVVGYRGEHLSVETKSTTDGHSQVDGPRWPSSDAALRICRIGAELSLYKRAIGEAAWQKAGSYTRPDLPPTLQVGPIAYAFHHAADLRASFDEVRFEVPGSAADCAR